MLHINFAFFLFIFFTLHLGVRYNAEKKRVGNYYTTPIYRFRMKCHLCDNHFEIETDPKVSKKSTMHKFYIQFHTMKIDNVFFVSHNIGSCIFFKQSAEYLQTILLLHMPQNCDYVIVSGARRKEERWEQSATEAIALTGTDLYCGQ